MCAQPNITSITGIFVPSVVLCDWNHCNNNWSLKTFASVEQLCHISEISDFLIAWEDIESTYVFNEIVRNILFAFLIDWRESLYSLQRIILLKKMTFNIFFICMLLLFLVTNFSRSVEANSENIFPGVESYVLLFWCVTPYFLTMRKL